MSRIFGFLNDDHFFLVLEIHHVLKVLEVDVCSLPADSLVEISKDHGSVV